MLIQKTQQFLREIKELLRADTSMFELPGNAFL